MSHFYTVSPIRIKSQAINICETFQNSYIIIIVYVTQNNIITLRLDHYGLQHRGPCAEPFFNLFIIILAQISDNSVHI